jgi:hypothetical protein
MTEFEYTLFYLFVLGIVLLSFIESYVIRHFQPAIFRMGVRICQGTRPLPKTGMKSGSVFETENGGFKVIGPG